MAATTKQNTITRLIGTRPYPILASSPYRKAIILSPLAGGSAGGVLLGAVFPASGAFSWTVPAGVTQLDNVYAFGAGGGPGQSSGALGAGGGGGGGFASSGPQPAIPGSIWSITVGQAAMGGSTSISNSTPAVVCQALSGTNGAADINGTGGAGSIGAILQSGGNGDAATLLAGDGAGAGGGAGSFANGSNAAVSVGGAGGGVATLLGYGVGGKGGNGSVGGAPGTNGGFPGGGGGGAGNPSGAGGVGAPGLAALFYTLPAVPGVISLSHRSDVQPGVGILNYLFGQTFPTTITDDDIGTFIQEEWWIVSSINGVPVQITEYLYDC